MKKNILMQLSLAILTTFGIVACQGKKQKTEENTLLAKDTIAWEGEYNALDKNLSGKGLLLTLKKDGTYSLLSLGTKTRGLIEATGDIEWTADGSHFSVAEADGLLHNFELRPDGLQMEDGTIFTKSQTPLIPSLVERIYKYDKDGSEMKMKIFSRNKEVFAKIEWGGVNTDSLRLEGQLEGSPLSFAHGDYKLVLDENKERAYLEIKEAKHQFALLTPTSATYRTNPKKGETPRRYYVHFVTTTNPVSLLIENDNGTIEILKARETFAQGGEYSNGEVTFRFTPIKQTITQNGEETILIQEP